MSGEKRSAIELNRIAELLLKIEGEKETAQAKCEELATRMESLIVKTKSVQTSDINVAKRFADYKTNLQVEAAKIKARQKEITSIKLPRNIETLSLDSLDKIRKKVVNCDGENHKAGVLIDQIDMDVINMSNADKNLASTEFNLQKMEEELTANERLLMKWAKEDLSKLRLESARLRVSFAQNKNLLKSRKDTGVIAKSTDDLQDALEIMLGRIKQLVKEANGKEEMHRKRLFVLAGIRGACASLGFEEVNAPKYEDETNYESTVLQTFDTLNDGLITFKLKLDNTIEADSGIRVGACENQFKILADLLNEKYGIKASAWANFKTDLPERMSNTAKPMPQSKPKAEI